MSPWKFFLYHFCDIANSALLRIQMLAREETLNKNLLFLNTIMSDTVGDRNILHDLNGQIISLAEPLKTLAQDARAGLFSPAHEELILGLEPARAGIESEMKSIVSSVKRNKRRPCSLDEAIAEAWEALQGNFTEYDIKIRKVILPEVLPGAMVNVPFNVAKYAFKNDPQQCRGRTQGGYRQ